MRFECSGACPVQAALELFGEKWKGIALFHLLDGTKRLNELKRKVGGVTQRMLTKQLRELGYVGLISRQVYAEVPPKVEYRPTEKGKSLRPILLALEKWGTRYALPQPSDKVKGACRRLLGRESVCL